MFICVVLFLVCATALSNLLDISLDIVPQWNEIYLCLKYVYCCIPILRYIYIYTHHDAWIPFSILNLVYPFVLPENYKFVPNKRSLKSVISLFGYIYELSIYVYLHHSVASCLKVRNININRIESINKSIHLQTIFSISQGLFILPCTFAEFYWDLSF